MKKGFTLIELLVVVLIIGILAAVALPQYQLAVTKAKLTRCIPLTRVVAESQERYFMANGQYTKQFLDLDVGIPEGATKIELGEVAEEVAFYPWGPL